MSQIPEISGSTDKGATITLSGGNVTAVYYTEGAFTAGWTSTAGTLAATKSTDSPANPPATAGSVTVS